ncbi:tripartite tricarboxylate transporter TctB family protein [Piscinibacter sakaiensis]|uniref:tripartite tricarboxylate transporter TctB family protein n=1 Tax=Piscinibacter sakaiensis TaxID=1547922 RepID=UPI003AACBFC5
MKLETKGAQLALGIGAISIALMLAIGAALLPVDKGYTVVGTGVFPFAVSLLMGIVGVALIWQSLTGGFRFFEEPALPPDAWPLTLRLQAAAWVSGGLLVNALLIERIGFTFAATILFAAAARGFGSRRWVANLLIGFALAWPIYLGFTLGLGLSLPGLARPWI